MIDFIRPGHPFEGQTQRLIAEAINGGGDVFEIGRTSRKIEIGDTATWQKEWHALAEEVETEAQAALAAGHKETAMRRFFSANQYYRQSDVFLTGKDPRKAEAFRKSQELFREGSKLHHPPIEVIEVSCGDERYDGYFCHPINPTPGKWPVVFLIGGADAFAEEVFFSGRQILDRGWAMLLVDTPGRGSSSYLKGIPTRADYEVPISACLDWVEKRPEINSDRIGIIGISMAGYYAPRAAAFDDRIKTLVGWCGCYDMLEDLYNFFEPLQGTLQRILGHKTDAEAREVLKEFHMRDAAPKIKCPTLITHGANDRLMNVKGARNLFEAIGVEDKTLKIYDNVEAGGTGHCQYDIWGTSTPFILDWMERRL